MLLTRAYRFGGRAAVECREAAVRRPLLVKASLYSSKARPPCSLLRSSTARPGVVWSRQPLAHPAQSYSGQLEKPGTGSTASKTTTTETKATAITSKPLHEEVWNIPNILTFSRLAAAPVVGYLILHDNHTWALGLLAYSAVTDFLDGWIARRWDKKTVVGTVIDPMADKALMAILTVALAIKGALPLWLATIILGRDAGLGVSAIYYRWISLPPPKTFTRYWDFSLPSAEVHPTTISKYNTFLQLALIGLTTAAPVVPWDVSTPLSLMQYTVAVTTIWSGASYIYTKDAVKILSTPKVPPKP
ncbi:CDP-alcohol phosphatidyltransferase-domain-containing protein [Plectosphaerella cucumerina]|uniref:CDP-alcohol phosphatidyltransferase-domain-containing protein n=1 Tax=Plectosphaerella cucumerina TaxID=40658 RepID=A0A8K0WYL2_9PEZI|nr:CDP-alcohol phosphatidyltransferase-domain-containing protein [Plectosphaerella cucumerina]